MNGNNKIIICKNQETAQKELQQHNLFRPNLRLSLIRDQAENPFNKCSYLQSKIKGIREIEGT
jgi:hypothetical protein